MGYTDDRSYINAAVAAQNVVSTASAAVVTSTNVQYFIAAEATFLCSIAGVITATPSSPPSTVKYAILSGTTTLGSITPGQTVGTGAFSTVVPPVAISSGGILTLSIVSTGTASATETAGAIYIVLGLAPQFV
jgi:hypothetical protein